MLEALQELGDGRWVPWEAVAAYVRSDARTPGVARLIERWAQRGGFEADAPADIARRIALESLHAARRRRPRRSRRATTDALGPTLRITPRGRAYLGDAPESRTHQLEPSRFIDNQALRIGPERAASARSSALAPFVEVGSVAGELDLLITPQTISHALSAGLRSRRAPGRARDAGHAARSDRAHADAGERRGRPR